MAHRGGISERADARCARSITTHAGDKAVRQNGDAFISIAIAFHPLSTRTPDVEAALEPTVSAAPSAPPAVRSTTPSRRRRIPKSYKKAIDEAPSRGSAPSFGH